MLADSLYENILPQYSFCAASLFWRGILCDVVVVFGRVGPAGFSWRIAVRPFSSGRFTNAWKAYRRRRELLVPNLRPCQNPWPLWPRFWPLPLRI